MNRRSAGLLVEPHRDGINWSMASSLDDASRRRIYVQLASRCALISSAAKRLAAGLDLDERENRALDDMRRDFREIAATYRSDAQPPSAGARRFAVTNLAFAAATLSTTLGDPSRDEIQWNRADLTPILDKRASELDTLINWSDDKDAAGELAGMYESLSRYFLGQVARPGESLEERRPRSLA